MKGAFEGPVEEMEGQLFQLEMTMIWYDVVDGCEILQWVSIDTSDSLWTMELYWDKRIYH